MKTAFVAALLGLALACSAVWAQNPAPSSPTSAAPATTAPAAGDAQPTPEMMAQQSMMAGTTEEPKKPFPIVPLAVAIAVIAIIAAVVMKQKGEGAKK